MEFVPEVVTETSVTFETSTVSSTTAELVTSVPETTSETSTLSSTTAESVTSVPDTTTITEGPAVLEKTTVSVAGK
ncbi:location of vulva defective 1-like [Xenopus tropicalis]|uniref:Location of vulva defective 1-like n=1 Tax=Xenopus tropicalis TaxID=8364 RepID=A0A8J1JLI3_XENTR|nr:location of vulva defective 1-like [Xenopus tropicalis]